MASINLCERCGVMAKSTAMGGVQHWLTPAHNMTGPAELCPGCVNDFLKFMAGEPAPIGDRPKAYHKPWEEPAKSDPLAGLSTEQLAAAFLARQADEQARELEQ